MFKVIFFTENLISITSVLPSNITVSHSTYRPYILMILNECGIYKEMICEEKALQKSTAFACNAKSFTVVFDSLSFSFSSAFSDELWKFYVY